MYDHQSYKLKKVKKNIKLFLGIHFYTKLNIKRYCVFMRKGNHLFFFQDQADVYVKELPIPDTLEKLENRGKGAMMSF